jgi:hypothetical protein
LESGRLFVVPRSLAIAACAGVLLLSPGRVFAATTTLFDGGHRDGGNQKVWNDRFGAFDGTQSVIRAAATVAVPGGPGLVHAEAQRVSAIGADFVYSADITLEAGAEAHLQFRIADEGRYGVRLRTTGIALYDFHLPPRGQCSAQQPNAINHCPLWQGPDAPAFTILRESTAFPSFPLASPSTHHVAVSASGSVFTVSLDGLEVLRGVRSDLPFAVGRFGIYVFGAATAVGNVTFANVRATTDPFTASNFALLYSTPGYDAAGTKRALVRTLNDIPNSVDLGTPPRFIVKRSDGTQATQGVLTRLSGKTFGMQLWEADFSSIAAAGSYTLEVDIVVPGVGNVTTLRSAPFEILPKFISSRILKPMSLANAEARRGADEDFWRNWVRESGTWAVGVDGAFIADRADAQAGAALTRIFNIDNTSLENLVTADPSRGNFRLSAA